MEALWLAARGLGAQSDGLLQPSCCALRSQQLVKSRCRVVGAYVSGGMGCEGKGDGKVGDERNRCCGH